jgi:hypothetical protein
MSIEFKDNIIKINKRSHCHPKWRIDHHFDEWNESQDDQDDVRRQEYESRCVYFEGHPDDFDFGIYQNKYYSLQNTLCPLEHKLDYIWACHYLDNKNNMRRHYIGKSDDGKVLWKLVKSNSIEINGNHTSLQKWLSLNDDAQQTLFDEYMKNEGYREKSYMSKYY